MDAGSGEQRRGAGGRGAADTREEVAAGTVETPSSSPRDESGPTRRRFLRRTLLGGSGALGALAIGGLLGRRSRVLGEASDVESVRAAVAAATSFELETAWLHESDEGTSTVPSQPPETFPREYRSDAAPTLRFDSLEPGDSGRLLGAFRLVGASGEVRCAGRVGGQHALAESIEVECWRPADLSLDRQGDEPVVFSGPLSAFPGEPFAATHCLDTETPAGIGLEYRLPDVDNADVRRTIEGASLEFTLQLIARQC